MFDWFKINRLEIISLLFLTEKEGCKDVILFIVPVYCKVSPKNFVSSRLELNRRKSFENWEETNISWI